MSDPKVTFFSTTESINNTDPLVKVSSEKAICRVEANITQLRVPQSVKLFVTEETGVEVVRAPHISYKEYQAALTKPDENNVVDLRPIQEKNAAMYVRKPCI